MSSDKAVTTHVGALSVIHVCVQFERLCRRSVTADVNEVSSLMLASSMLLQFYDVIQGLYRSVCVAWWTSTDGCVAQGSINNILQIEFDLDQPRGHV